MPYINNKSLIENIRKQKPRVALGLSDRQIYDYAVANYNPEKISGIKGAQYRPWPEDKPTFAGTQLPTHTPPEDDTALSPRTWAEVSLAGGLGDMFDWNYGKYAASQGMTDLARVAMTGKSGYQLKDKDGNIISPEEYAADLNFFEDAAAWVFGQVNPADAALWVGTGGIGKYFQIGGKAVGMGKATLNKGSLNYIQKKYQDSAVRTGVQSLRKKNNSYSRWLADWIEKAPSTAMQIGTFSFAHSTIHSAAQQKKETGKVDVGLALYEGGKSGIEGLMLGTITAGVHSAIVTPLAKQAMKYEKSNSQFKKNLANILKKPATSMVPAVGLEGAIFGNLPYLWHGTPQNEDGSVNWHQVGHDWAHATSVISLLKGSVGAFNYMGRKMRAEVKDDYETSTSGKNKTIESKNAEETKKNLEKNLKDQGFDDIYIEEVVRMLHEGELKNLKDVNLDELGGKEKLVEIFERSKEIRDKLEKGEELTTDEINQVVYEVWPAAKILNQINHERISSPEAFDKYLDRYIASEFKKEYGRDWDVAGGEKTKFGEALRKVIEKNVNRLDKANASMNDSVYKPRQERRVKIKEDVAQEQKLLKRLNKDQKKEFNERIAERDKLLKERKFEEAAERTKEIREDLEAPTPKDKIKALERRIRTLAQNKGIKTAEVNKLLKIEKDNAKGDEQALVEGLKELEKDYRREKDEGVLPDEADTVDVETFRKKKSKHKKLASEINERRERLADEQSKIEDNKPFKEGTKEDKNYQSSYEIIKHIIQNVLPEKFSERGARTKKKLVKGAEAPQKTKMLMKLNTALKRVRELNEFATWLAERGLNFSTMKNEHLKRYLGENKGHRWALSTLIKEISSLDLTVKYRADANKLGQWAGVAQETPAEGLKVETADFAKEGKDNYLRVIVGKTGEYVNKYISIKLRGLFRKLKKEIGSGDYFKDTKGTSFLNEQINGFTDFIFGPKGQKFKARLLRDSLAGWAKRRHGQAAKDLIMKEVLFEDYVKDNVVSTYGNNPISQKKAADKLVKQYLKEISNGGKKEDITAHYSTKEIANALKKIKEHEGDITFKDTNGKEVTIDKLTAEALARTLIETAPRLNEVVPSEAPKAPKKTTTSKQERQTLPPGTKRGHAETPTEKIKREKLRKKYDDIVKEVKDNQKELYDEKGDPLSKDVPETVKDGVVRVRAGASVEAAIHGMGHSVYKFLYSVQKSMPNTRLGKTAAGIIRHMQKSTSMTKKSRDRVKEWTKTYMEKDGMNYKDARKRAIEETFVELTGEYVAGRVMDKGVFKRITDWMERTYQLAKSRFKSVDKLTEREAIVLYGEDFIYRKTIPRMTYKRPVGKDKMEFMTYTDNMSDLQGIARNMVKDYIKKSKLLKTKDYRNFITELARDMQVDFLGEKFELKAATEQDVLNVIKRLGQVDSKKISGKEDVISLLQDLREIKRYRIKTDYDTTYEKKWLKLNDVPSGDIMDASPSLRAEWKSLLYERRVDKNVFNAWETSLENLIDKANVKKFLGRLEPGVWNEFKMNLAKNGMSIIKFAKYLGMDNLSKWNYRHITSELNYVGKFLDFIDNTAPREIGAKTWDKVRPLFMLMEVSDKGEFVRLNDPTVSKKEKSTILKFIKKAFIVDTKIDKRKKEGSQKKLINKGINWDPKTGKGSKEGRLLYYFKHTIMKDYVRNFNELLDIKFTKAGKEDILKRNDISFLNKSDVAFFLPRRFTKEFANNFDVGNIQYQKTISARANEIAIELASNQYRGKYNKATTKEKAKMVKEFIDRATVMSKGELFTAASFGATKFKLGNLVNRVRHKFDETVTTKDGKKIKVWETDFEAGMLPFATGWAKLLSNMEHAPWAVGLKGYSMGGDLSKVINELSMMREKGMSGSIGKDVKEIIHDGVMQRVGMQSSPQYNRSSQGMFRDYTATLMRLQLGGPLPLSGIKNYFEQAKQMVHTFVFGDVINNALLAFNAKERSKTEFLGGVGSIGMTSIKPGSERMRKSTEAIFKSGLMPFTESVGRTWARLAGTAEYRRLTDIVHLHGEKHPLYEKAITRFKEFYELADYQVDLLKRYGADPNFSKLSKSDATMIGREMNNISRQIEMISHSKTAGSTLDANMPWWANIKGAKPLLMYKRIAIQTTTNNTEMMRYNIKNRHFMRSAMFLGGTAASGALRLGILKMVLGQTMPDENSDWMNRFATTMWAGEFLGILSEIFSPYSPFRSGDLLSGFSLENNSLFDAAITSHMAGGFQLLSQLGGHYSGAWESDLLPGQAVNKFMRMTAAGWNNTYKVMSLRMNQYAKDHKAVTMWQKDFDGKHGFFSSRKSDIGESRKYFNALKTAFNHGNMEDVNEAAILGFLGYASDRISKGVTWNQALKDAEGQLKTKLKDLNPIQYSFDPQKDYLISPIDGFLLGLEKDKLKIVARSYFAYEKRLNEFNSQFGYYLRKKNLKEFAKHFDFKMDKKFDKAMKKLK